jgi:hypothetical protein
MVVSTTRQCIVLEIVTCNLFRSHYICHLLIYLLLEELTR